MSKARGRTLEYEIEQTIEPYREDGQAHLMKMPVPTVPTGQQGKYGPIMRLAGQAPWDFIGFAASDARTIGCEAKETTERATSLPIIRPGRDGGSGLQWHQITALAALWEAGGHPHIVWANAGEIAVLAGAAIWNQYASARAAAEAKQDGRKAERGALSIPWEAFDPVEHVAIEGAIIPDWLRLNLSPAGGGERTPE